MWLDVTAAESKDLEPPDVWEFSSFTVPLAQRLRACRKGKASCRTISRQGGTSHGAADGAHASEGPRNGSHHFQDAAARASLTPALPCACVLERIRGLSMFPRLRSLASVA